MPGIDFILRANSAAFTKGLASADNALKDLKKTAKGLDLGGAFGKAVGIGAIVQGFRLAITNAQELRDEAAKLGKPIDDSTRSVAELGDAISNLGGGFKNALTEGLSFFTQLGDGARRFFQGITMEQEKAARDMVATTGKAADEAEKRLKKSREENSPERLASARKETAQAEMEGALKGTDGQKQLAKLVNERAELLSEQRALGPAQNTVKAEEIRAKLIRNENAIKKANVALDKEASDEAKKKADQQAKLSRAQFEGLTVSQQNKVLKESEKSLEESISDLKKQGIDSTDLEIDLQEIRNKRQQDAQKIVEQYAPSVEQLAKMEVGGFASGDDPRLKARKVLQEEERSRLLYGRGDLKGGLEAATKAQEMRDGLSTMTGNGAGLTKETAEAAFSASLTATNGKLDELTKAVSGIIKAQK